MSLIQEAHNALTKFHQIEENKRWYMPFPMGVFGTLRCGRGNDHLMHGGKVELWKKAFMPHFAARGLGIHYSKGSSAPFEVYFYQPDQWDKMIPRVDALESFSPSWGSSFGYHRTLAWLHLLPDDFTNEWFSDRYPLSANRDLRLPQETWEEYEKVPCWVYSSKHQNEQAKGCGTIIWE